MKRAVGRGVILQHTSPDVLLDLIYGPMHHRLSERHLPLGDRFVQVVASTILSGTQTGARISQ